MIGVSASGMTSFVRGALTRARQAGARIIFVTCDPRTELQTFVDLTIAPAVGPEVIAGSTRLKAGTATKLVLNMITTGAMILIGKTYGNLMVDVQTNSDKLRDRAKRIVHIVTGIDADRRRQAAAQGRLERQGRDRDAEDRAARTPKPLARLRKAKDLVRDAIGEDIEPRLRELIGAVRQRLAGAPARPASPSPAGAAAETTPAARVVTPPFDHRRARRRPSLPPSPSARSLARCRIVAIPIVSASRGTRRRSPPNHSALAARVGSSSATHGACAAVSAVGRLVEADMAVGADAEDQDVEPARRGDRALVALALGARSAARPSRNPMLCGCDVDVREQPLLHEATDSCRDRPRRGRRIRRD